MDLSEEILNGLHMAGEAVNIPDKSFVSVLNAISESLVDSEHLDFKVNKDLSSLDPAMMKQVYVAVAALLLEAAKLDKDATAISQVLEDCKFDPERSKQFNAVYQLYKPELRNLLSKIQSNPPHIVDVDWRLDYYIKNNHLEKVSCPVFLIKLKTQVNFASEDSDMLQIACTQGQLQDLVAKLKDACKSLERVAQM